MNRENTPKHVAIIPDGNRRWAKARGLKGIKGHVVATSPERIIAILDEAMRFGVKYFSLWGFSTENWNRSESEKIFLFKLIFKLVENLRDYAHKKQIRFRQIGRKDRLPKYLVDVMNKFEKETKEYSNLNIQLCLDYGGRDDIVRAINKLLKEGKKEIDEKEFAKYLDTAEIPDPELIIRTGGEFRLSGLFSFQSAYTELYFTKTHFPDFTPEDFREAIMDFSKRTRTYGGD